VGGIAVDIADFAGAQMHAYAATARAHVAGRRLDFELLGFQFCGNFRHRDVAAKRVILSAVPRPMF
jgi:hypothetical protein